MHELLLHFLLHFFDVLLFASRVKIEFMVVFGNAEFTADALGAKLANTDDFLWEVVQWTFEQPIHCNHINKP